MRPKLLGKASSKAQSAMEYLMTYGWAILVIAVVLGVLYSLGIFNPSNFAPKAQPGSCQVLRPNGPGTGSNVNLGGTCTGTLPQYVGVFNSNTAYTPVSGFSSSTYVTAYSPLHGTDYPFTLALWVNIPYLSPGSSWTEPIIGFSNYQALGLLSGGSGLVLHRCTSADVSVSTQKITFNRWHFVAVSTSGNSSYTFALDSNDVYATNTNAYSSTSNSIIGGQYQTCDGNPFVGSIANVQMYNVSLNGTALNALYMEGIGGAPIDPRNLVAWYPLNGNANDYSGNNNNGVPSNVGFTGSWGSGYTAP